MRVRHSAGIALALLCASGFAAVAEDTGCTGFKWPIDRERAAFAVEGLAAVESGGRIGAGRGAPIHLVSQGAADLPVQPSRRPKNTPSYAGAFALDGLEAGSYTVTISQDAWIDVVQEGRILHQTGFTGSKTCADVRKSVRFDIGKGAATVMITDAAQDRLKLAVLPSPP